MAAVLLIICVGLTGACCRVSHGGWQDVASGNATKDLLINREQQIATSVAARELGDMLRRKVQHESFRITQDIKLLKQKTMRVLDVGVTRGGGSPSRDYHTFHIASTSSSAKSNRRGRASQRLRLALGSDIREVDEEGASDASSDSGAWTHTRD